MNRLDQPPNLPSDMVPANNVGMQQSPEFPMGDRTVLLQTAMTVEKMLAQLAPLSPTMSMLIQNFVVNFRKVLVDSLPEQNVQSAPSPQAALLGGAQPQPMQQSY